MSILIKWITIFNHLDLFKFEKRSKRLKEVYRIVLRKTNLAMRQSNLKFWEHIYKF